MLAVNSLPLHLLYNSAIVARISAVQYTVYYVDPSFLTGGTIDPEWEYYRGKFEWLQAHVNTLKNASRLECIEDYAQQFQTAWGDVLLVGSTKNTQSNRSVWYVHDMQPGDL